MVKQPTPEQLVAYLIARGYPQPAEILQAAKQAKPGALAAAAVDRLVAPQTRNVAHALVVTLQTLGLTAEQRQRIEQAWLERPDPTRSKALVYLGLLLSDGSLQAPALAAQLNPMQARALLDSDWRGDRWVELSPARRKALGEVAEICAERADESVVPSARPAPPPGQFRYYRVTATLVDAPEPASRTFLLADDADWDDLHFAIQRASQSWGNEHLWAFYLQPGGQLLVSGADDVDGLCDPGDALAELVETGRRSFLYRYDFGDNWKVRVAVAAKAELRPAQLRRVLLAGTGAFPPEDCGGAWGHERLVVAARARDAAQARGEVPAASSDDFAGGWDGHWHPDSFDLAAAQKAFDSLM